MLEDDLRKMLLRGTRPVGSGRRVAKSKTGRKKAPKKKSTGAKSGYMAHVKKYQRAHPNLSWRDCMIKARSSYIPKKPTGRSSGSKSTGKRGSARAGTMAGTMAGRSSLRQKASQVNKKLRDTKAITKTLRALSAIPTPLSGYAADAALISSSLGYGKRR